MHINDDEREAAASRSFVFRPAHLSSEPKPSEEYRP
jgi:hypothetical protein